MNDSVGFIGGGRVVRIILEGWARAKTTPARVVVTDPNRAVLGKLAERFPAIRVAADATEAAGQDVVFLATPPPLLAAAAGGARRRDFALEAYSDWGI
jgi:pyrroline-5-carboxylate reductase